MPISLSLSLFSFLEMHRELRRVIIPCEFYGLITCIYTFYQIVPVCDLPNSCAFIACLSMTRAIFLDYKNSPLIITLASDLWRNYQKCTSIYYNYKIQHYRRVLIRIRRS